MAAFEQGHERSSGGQIHAAVLLKLCWVTGQQQEMQGLPKATPTAEQKGACHRGQRQFPANVTG
jgi:hypothetical protein